MPYTATILLVDDDPIYATFVRSCLDTACRQLSLHHVLTPEEALNYVQAKAPYENRQRFPLPAIILLDLNLGISSGFPVLAWLQSNGHLAGQKVRVIVLTASSDQRDLQQALQLGATSFLIKSPLTAPLINLVTKLLPSPS